MVSHFVALVGLCRSLAIWYEEITRTLSVYPTAPLLAAVGVILVLLVGVVVLTARLIERLPLWHAPPRRGGITTTHPVALCALSAPDAPGKTRSRAPSAILRIA